MSLSIQHKNTEHIDDRNCRLNNLVYALIMVFKRDLFGWYVHTGTETNAVHVLLRLVINVIITNAD